MWGFPVGVEEQNNVGSGGQKTNYGNELATLADTEIAY
jgi:hypothetical protein